MDKNAGITVTDNIGSTFTPYEGLVKQLTCFFFLVIFNIISPHFTDLKRLDNVPKVT